MTCSEIIKRMELRGIGCNAPIKADGVIHRFVNTYDDSKSKNGWYVLHENGGAFGDWKLGVKETISCRGLPLTEDQVKNIDHKERRARFRNYKMDLMEVNIDTAKKAYYLWKQYSSKGCSEYLNWKQVGGYGIKYKDKSIVIPIHDIDNRLWNLQFINENSEKRFLKSGKKKGCFYRLGVSFSETKSVYICEGYATAASIYEAGAKTVIVAFDVGNLEPVVESIRSKFPHLHINIIADNDQWSAVNIGKQKAQQLSKKYGCKVILPDFSEIL